MRNELLYLDDALTAIRDLRAFMAVTREEEYLDDRLKQSFVFHRLVIIGEAVVRLRPSYEAKYPGVPWAQLTGLRNRLVHAYFELNVALLWRLASEGLGALEQELHAISCSEFPEPQEPA